LFQGAAQTDLKPPPDVTIRPGEHAPQPGARTSGPLLLDLVCMVSQRELPLEKALRQLSVLSEQEPAWRLNAALVAAEALDWIEYA
jgi:hypothetical protein